ncbi:hypothetical protein BAY61_27105 [Prauserella marina]|uniref:hypothetical protein n=1 Tax=Prauserella marina TaxID=530584 RepID=UPI000B89996A|nr:hypothetical protein [Prauserella marina]ASR38070.1 hypothetical protein BAY61_27105 [Prauserella marina]
MRRRGGVAEIRTQAREFCVRGGEIRSGVVEVCGGVVEICTPAAEVCIQLAEIRIGTGERCPRGREAQCRGAVPFALEAGEPYCWKTAAKLPRFQQELHKGLK